MGISTFANQPIFSDGQGIVSDDLNAVGDYARALLYDQIIAPYTSLSQSQTPTDTLFAPTAFHCYPTPGASAMTVTNSEGVLAQSVGAPDGLTPKLLMYRTTANELLTTIATADATHARWDGIFIKLSAVDSDLQQRDFRDEVTGVLTSQLVNTKRRTQLDKVVVTGTAASSPAFPATPSGYVPWAYVYVPAAYSSVFTTRHISDERVPMRMGSSIVYAAAMGISAATVGTIAYSATTYNVAAGGSGNTNGSISILLPLMGSARPLAVHLLGSGATGATTAMKLSCSDPVASYFGSYSADGFDGSLTALPATVTLPATNLRRPAANRAAVWGNGYAAGPAQVAASTTNDSSFLVLALLNVAAGVNINAARLLYAF